MMSGQNSLRGRSLCVEYSLARYVFRRLARVVRLVRWRRVRGVGGLFGGCFGV